MPYTGDYRIEAVGAAGGYDTGSHKAQLRGRGARMIGTFKLSKGEIIQILIGQEGGINKRPVSSGGGGGGGGTFVVRKGNKPLIIAGGGGGVTWVSSRHKECDASTSKKGKSGYRSWSAGSIGQGADTSNGCRSGKNILCEQISIYQHQKNKVKHCILLLSHVMGLNRLRTSAALQIFYLSNSPRFPWASQRNNPSRDDGRTRKKFLNHESFGDCFKRTPI